MNKENEINTIKQSLLVAALIFVGVLAFIGLYGWWNCASVSAERAQHIEQLNDEVRRSHQKIGELMRQK